MMLQLCTMAGNESRGTNPEPHKSSNVDTDPQLRGQAPNGT